MGQGGRHTERDGVIGRSAELAEGKSLLDALDGGPSALVVRGEAGIGKSAILDAILEDARSRGYSVLSCRPAEAETTLALVGLGDLLGETAEEAIAELPPPQRQALEVALLRSEPDGYVADWRAVGTGLRSVLVSLTRSAPVVVAVDDVQWLDRPTVRVVEFAVRRLGSLPVGVLAAARTPDYAQTPLSLDRALPARSLRELELGPLSLGAIYQLLRSRLGARLPRPTLLRVEEASGGNPFYALEIGRELLRTGEPVSPTEPLPLPRTLSDLPLSRIRRLPAETQDALLVAAASSHPTVELLASAIGDEDAVARALTPAEQSGVINVTGRRIAFTHPLLASAAYAHASSDQRRRAHVRLASTVRSPEERARHLALATARRNERVASALSTAAGRLAARGAPEEAAELHELAAERTPVRLVDERVTRLLAAAELHDLAGAHGRASAILDELVAELPPGARRADALLLRATGCHDDFAEMAALCERALAEAGDDDRRAARIHERLSVSWHVRGDNAKELEHARRGLAHAARAEDTGLELMLGAAVGRAETWSLSVTPGLLERAAGLEDASDVYLPFEQSPSASLGMRLFYSGWMDEGRRCLERALARASDAGDEFSRVAALLQLAALEFFAGRWSRGVELADSGLELEEQLGAERGTLRLYRALLAAGLGEVEPARSMAESAADRARDAGETHVELLAKGVLGFVELSVGHSEQAALILGEVLDTDVDSGTMRASRYLDDGIEALVANGELERARRHAARFTEIAGRSPMLVARAKAARCRGLVLAAAGDLDDALVELREALAAHEVASQPFEAARALLTLGTIRRRAKQRRAARDAFEEALATFESLPAPLWAERARAELARTGVRRRTTDGLTETEELVARLAARGLTNREIAQQAFLTPKSVEDVLRRVYRSVGVRNKTELATRLAERSESVEPARSR